MSKAKQTNFANYDLIAEQSVLCSILLLPTTFKTVAGMIGEHDFFSPDHRQIFAAIAELNRVHRPINTTLLADLLKQRSQFEKIGGAAYLAELIESRATAKDAKFFAEIVWKHSHHRQTRQALSDALEGWDTGKDSIDDLLCDLDHRRREQEQRSGRAANLRPLSECVEEFIARPGNEADLLPSGLPGVDASIGGLARGELVLVAGRPGHGKTVSLMQSIEELSRQVPALVISEEMTAASLARRTVAGFAELPEACWRESTDALRGNSAEFFRERQPIVLAESCGTIQRAIDCIERAKEQYDIGAAAVDYIQLLRGDGNNRYEQVSDVSTRLKQAAVRFDIVLLAACQLNRESEKKTNSNGPVLPRTSELRDSGQLEQDADAIIFVHWPWQNDHTIDKGEYRILIAKSRNREIKNPLIQCTFQAHRQKLVPRRTDDW